MVIPNEAFTGSAPGCSEEVTVSSAEGLASPADVRPDSATETLRRGEVVVEVVEVVEVGTEVPYVEVMGRSDGKESERDPTLGEILSPLELLAVTSLGLMSVVITTMTTAKT